MSVAAVVCGTFAPRGQRDQLSRDGTMTQSRRMLMLPFSGACCYSYCCRPAGERPGQEHAAAAAVLLGSTLMWALGFPSFKGTNADRLLKVAHNDQALRGAIPAVRRSQSPRCGKRGVGPHRPRTSGMWRHTATRTCFQTSPAHNFEKLNSTPLGVQFPPFRVYSHRPASEYGPNDEAVASCSGACCSCNCPAQEHTAAAAAQEHTATAAAAL